MNFTDITNMCGIYLAAIIVFLTILYFIQNFKNLPPGPIGFPFIGYWPFLKTNTCHQQLLEMSRKYGDVSSFTVFGYLNINLGTFKAAREAVLTKSENFNFRIKDFSLLRNTFNNGVFFVNGDGWKVLRKFFLQEFKGRGFNSFKETNCGPIYEAVKESVEDLSKANGKPIDIVTILSQRSSQILQKTLFDEKSVSIEEIREICKCYEIILTNMTGPNLLLVGDFARYFILPFTQDYREAMKHNCLMHKKMFSIIDNHKSSFDETNLRDIIDSYFKERNDRRSRNDSSAQYFTDEALESTILQFIGDGIVTVSVFVCAFIRALLEHPEEQEKIFQEVIEVVGIDREPSVEDKSKLPYTNAFIMEVVRTCDVFPFFPDLECTKDTTLQGYKIPKGSLLIMSSWSAHHDPKEYEEPNTFNPSRYIVTNGKRKPEAPILFGLGKRACMGEGFAMSQSFLFLTTIVKHFRLSKAVGANEQLLFLVGKLEICAHPRELA